MVIESVTDEILAIVRKWQDGGQWAITYGAAESFRKHRARSAEQFKASPHESERSGELSEQYHQRVIAAHQEFCDLSNWLRLHSPKLLEFVPHVNFFEPPAELTAFLRDLRKLEGELLATPAVNGGADSDHHEYTRWLEAPGMVSLLKANEVGTSDQSIARYKRCWLAEIQPGSNNRRFRFKVETLKSLGLTIPSALLAAE